MFASSLLFEVEIFLSLLDPASARFAMGNFVLPGFVTGQSDVCLTTIVVIQRINQVHPPIGILSLPIVHVGFTA